MGAHENGERLRRLRLVNGISADEFAKRVGLSPTVLSHIETGRYPIPEDSVTRIATTLDCAPSFVMSDAPELITTRPWLRAYADAPKRAMDRQLADCSLAIEVIERLQMRLLPDAIPTFTGDPSSEDDIEQFAADVRQAAQIDEFAVVGNAIRAAERLGCLVLPMNGELGRHLGMSSRMNLHPVICVSRPSEDPDQDVPGDRQRFTVCHEIGHLGLHGGLGPPQTSTDAALIERQAHRFAGAFLAPGDAILEDLREIGNGRVTLRTLAAIKQRWGIAIKALVMRFQQLGVIEPDQARSLYKQISARGWNKDEPVPVSSERAVWFEKAIAKRGATEIDPLRAVAEVVGVGQSHFDRWTDWSPTPATLDAKVVSLPKRQGARSRTRGSRSASVTTLRP